MRARGEQLANRLAQDPHSVAVNDADTIDRTENGAVEKLVDLEVGIQLLMGEVVKRGIDSRPGKAAWASALRTIEVWHRIANTLGLERRAQPVPSLHEILGRTDDA